MPILKGSVTFARYCVEHSKQPPSDVKRWFLRGLQSQAFEPVDRRGDDDRSAGFAELEDVDSVEFAASRLYAGERALFTWRVDQLRVSAAAVRQELDAWTKNFEKENDRKPARAEKTAAKAAIRDALRSKAPVITKTHDVAWNLKTRQLQIWSASRKTVDEILAAIETGFEAKLIGLSPGALALAADAGDSLKPTLSLVAGQEAHHGAA